MKHTFPRSSMVAAVLALVTSMAHAHPGHSVFDPFAGPPHAGHADQWSSLLLSMILTALLLLVSRRFSGRHR